MFFSHLFSIDVFYYADMKNAIGCENNVLENGWSIRMTIKNNAIG